MANKLKFSDLFQDDIFGKVKASATDMLQTLPKVLQGLQSFAKDAQAEIKKINFNDIEGIEKLSDVFTKADKIYQGFVETQKTLIQLQKQQKDSAQALNNVQKQNVKLQEEQLNVTDEQLKENQKLKLQRSERIKEIKQEVKESEGLVSEYQKQSKRLNDLRKRYKDLALTQKGSTKESSELLKEIRELDKELKDIDASVGQFQRSVGDYGKEALGSTKATLGWAAAIVGLNGGLDDLNKGLEANEEGSKDLNKIVAEGGAFFQTYFNRIGQATSGIIDFVKQTVTGEGGLIQFNSTLAKISNSFNGVFDAAVKNADAAGKAADEQFDLERSSLALREALELLNGEFEKQSAIAGDGTRSFNEQEEAAIKAQRANEARLKIQTQLAKQELAIIEQRIKGTEDDANRFALESEASEKRIELQALQNELVVASIENEKVLREVSRDRFERELDFAIDAFDAQKTVNERLIADDRKTLTEKQAIFDKTVELAESSFTNQIALTEGFLGQQTDLRQLVLEEDEQVIRERLKTLTADDVALGRILEIIRERKFVLQDIADLEKDISDEVQEQLETRLQAVDDVDNVLRQRNIDRINDEVALESTSNERKIELLNERTSIEEEILRNTANTELRNSELTAEQRKVIEEQLVNDLANLEQQRLDDVNSVNEDIAEADLELSKDRIQTATDTAQQVNEAFSEAFDEAFDDRVDALNKEESLIQQRLSEQQALSEQGLANQAEFERQKLTEIQAERRQLQQQQQIIEEAEALALAYLNFVQARAKEDPDSAPFKALQDVATVATIKGSAKALANLVVGSAYDGTEDTGTISGGGLDGKGGRLWMLHDNEAVIRKSSNQKYDGLAKAMNNQDVEGWIMRNMATDVNIDRSQVSSNMTQLEQGFNQLSNEVNAVKKAIQDQPVQMIDADGLGNIIERIVAKGVENKIIHQRFKKKI